MAGALWTLHFILTCLVVEVRETCHIASLFFHPLLLMQGNTFMGEARRLQTLGRKGDGRVEVTPLLRDRSGSAL